MPITAKSAGAGPRVRPRWRGSPRPARHRAPRPTPRTAPAHLRARRACRARRPTRPGRVRVGAANVPRRQRVSGRRSERPRSGCRARRLRGWCSSSRGPPRSVGVQADHVGRVDQQVGQVRRGAEHGHQALRRPRLRHAAAQEPGLVVERVGEPAVSEQPGIGIRCVTEPFEQGRQQQRLDPALARDRRR